MQNNLIKFAIIFKIKEKNGKSATQLHWFGRSDLCNLCGGRGVVHIIVFHFMQFPHAGQLYKEITKSLSSPLKTITNSIRYQSTNLYKIKSSNHPHTFFFKTVPREGEEKEQSIF